MLIKILPIKNPNYEMKETPEQLIALVNNSPIYILDEEDSIIDMTIPYTARLIDDFIYAETCWDSLDGYAWCNAMVMVDEEKNISKIAGVNYKKRSDKMSFIYYAHFVGDYNTKIEQNDIRNIYKMFPNCELINPNLTSHNESYKKFGMQYFYEIIKDCDILVFRGLYNGKITAGVYGEIKTAEKCNIPIIEFSSNYDDRNLTVEQTRDILKLSL